MSHPYTNYYDLIYEELFMKKELLLMHNYLETTLLFDKSRLYPVESLKRVMSEFFFRELRRKLG